MSFKIIDAHMHLGASPDYLAVDQSLGTLLKVMDRLDIERAISAHSLSLRDRYEEGIALDRQAHEASGGRIFSFICYGPHHPQPALDAIRAHRAERVFRGIKLHPSGAFVDADSELYRPAWEIARELKLPILSHTWNVSSYHPSQKSAWAGKFEKYAAEYPDVTFVFGHSGGRYDGIVEAVRIGRAHKNCYFDIAGDIWDNGMLEYLIDNLGAERVLYGSDCYMIEQRPMLGVVLGSSISDADKEKILRHNALKVYFADIG
ncbi:amidohydrolase family protein [Bacillota bacterium Meth-B3]